MKYFSMFSGIGGFELGIQQALPDSECVGFSEVDKYAISIYKKHFKGHHNYGDATRIIPSELPDFELLVGGFPCQAFSLAGKRRGFGDTRGTLFFEIARVLREKRPRLLVLENVKGLLSHDEGRSLSVISATLDELGYDLQWNVCNSKNYGVPQNRERIFIVGHLRATGQSHKQIFPITKGNRQSSSIPENNKIMKVVQLNQTNLKSNGKEPYYQDRVYDPFALSPALSKFSEPKVACLMDEKFINTNTQRNNKIMKVGNVNPSGNGANGNVFDVKGLSPTITTNKGEGVKTICFNSEKGINPDIMISREDGVSYALTKTHANHPIQVISGSQGNRVYDVHGISVTQSSSGGGVGYKTGLYAVPVITPDRVNKRQNGRRFKEIGDPSFTVTAQDRHGVLTNKRIRRLMPIECERLQGFPDNWTKYGCNGQEISDSQRYKCCGNAVTVNVVASIFKQLIL